MAGKTIKKESTPFDGVIKSCVIEAKDDKHFYEFTAGKKNYKWRVIFEKTDTDGKIPEFVCKLAEFGPQPFNAGDRIKSTRDLCVDEDGTHARYIHRTTTLIDANGKPIVGGGMSKSTWNDPTVVAHKFKAESLRRSLRIILKLKDWTLERAADESATGIDDPYHIQLIKDPNLQNMASVFYNWITQDGTDLNRDVVELRAASLDNAISCMDLPSYTKLKGNDEHLDEQNKIVVDKKLTVKICEQAEIFLAFCKV